MKSSHVQKVINGFKMYYDKYFIQSENGDVNNSL